ncbi:MAG TPA: hypothetical protein VFV58_13285 [Blastocatellia bacterium]|jgi:hypothetical protein|nr:hypothetical protein [Blastocatellia bacterium]
MTANQLLERMAARGVRVTLDGDELKVDAPAGMLTDEDRHRLYCYKVELLWRLRHPEGDPPASGYAVPHYIDGKLVRIPLDRLIAEGREIVARENLRPKTKGFDPDMWAAAVALERYDSKRREVVRATL